MLYHCCGKNRTYRVGADECVKEFPLLRSSIDYLISFSIGDHSHQLFVSPQLAPPRRPRLQPRPRPMLSQ